MLWQNISIIAQLFTNNYMFLLKQNKIVQGEVMIVVFLNPSLFCVLKYKKHNCVMTYYED